MNDHHETPEPTRTHEYVVGLPVAVSVRSDGFVTVEVDLSELGQAIADDENEHGYWETEIALDAELADEWAAGHAVRNEGFAR